MLDRDRRIYSLKRCERYWVIAKMSNVSAPTQDGGAEKASQHEHETAEREAYEYWGYLFKSDKTGTDRLKGLLRGLKELMVR